jgi:signal transduction histidine kinase
MKSVYFILLLMSISLFSSAQKMTDTTSSFIIKGKVLEEKTIELSKLSSYQIHALFDVNTSCSPKKEERIKQAKGILLKDILDSVKFDYDKGAHLNEFYFVFIAADGYKLVYSYNEIFNTQTGLNLYLVTELDNNSILSLPNSLLILTTSDIKGGRRNLKWLKEIRVCRAE